MRNTAMQPKNVACIGRMDSGKSFLLRLILQASNRSLLVYNAGRDSDWDTCTLIYLEVADQALYFWYEDECYPFDQYMTYFKGQLVKCFADEEAEPLLWKALGQQRGRPFAGLSLVVDDASGILASGRLTNAQKRFLSKSKHLGLEVYLVFHGFQFVPLQLWGLLTHAVVFITHVPPPLRLTRQLGTSTHQLLQGVYQLLKASDRFCYARIDFNQMSWQLFGPGGTRFIPTLHQKKETVLDTKKIELLKIGMPVLEAIVGNFLLQPFQHLSQTYDIAVPQLLSRVRFEGATLHLHAYHHQQVVVQESLQVEDCIDHILSLGLDDANTSGMIPPAVTQTLSLMGIGLTDILNKELLTAILSGELVAHKTLYLAAPKGQVVYLVCDQEGAAHPIKFAELWKL